MPENMPKYRYRTLALLMIVVLGSAAYSNTFRVPFMFDGICNIYNNPMLHLSSLSQVSWPWLKSIYNIGRPVTRLSFAFNHYLNKLDPSGYHLVNLIIHLLSAILLFSLLYVTLRLPGLAAEYHRSAYGIALLTSLLFLCHPVNTQAVTFIYQRTSCLAAMFYLGAMLSYVTGRLAEGNKRYLLYGLAALCTCLAWGSKQNTITLPLFIILYELYFLQPKGLPGLKRLAPYVIGALALTLLVTALSTRLDFWNWIVDGYRRRPFTLRERVFTEFRVIVYYVSLILLPLPSRQNLDYDFPLSHSLLEPAATLPAGLLLLGCVFLAIYLYRRTPLVSFGILWFLGNLAVESSIIPLELVFEHRLYLPAIGLFLLFSSLVHKAVERLAARGAVHAMLARAALGMVVLLLALAAYSRNEVWGSEISLWRDVLKKSPRKPRVHLNLGLAYSNHARYSEAIAHYQAVLKTKPNSVKTRLMLGDVYRAQGSADKAIAEYQRVLDISPDSTAARQGLAGVYDEQGLTEQADEQYGKILKLDPGCHQAAGCHDELKPDTKKEG
jgi:tetratricopeptide (TPR) repeat protein